MGTAAGSAPPGHVMPAPPPAPPEPPLPPPVAPPVPPPVAPPEPPEPPVPPPVAPPEPPAPPPGPVRRHLPPLHWKPVMHAMQELPALPHSASLTEVTQPLVPQQVPQFAAPQGPLLL